MYKSCDNLKYGIKMFTCITPRLSIVEPTDRRIRLDVFLWTTGFGERVSSREDLTK